MLTFSINTLGCKVNQYEGQQVRELLEKLDLKQVELTDAPDLTVVNTCCVTHIASAKSRQYIRKIQKHSPEAIIIVAGCLPAGQNNELKDTVNNSQLHIISQKNDLAKTLGNIINSHFNSRTKKDSKIKDKALFQGNIGRNKPVNKTSMDTSLSSNALLELGKLNSYAGQSRAFLKVQDGCDGYCTYCIVPKVRNKINNKPIEDVLQEASNLVYAGHQEIVLTGIFLGAYGQDTVRRKNWDQTKIDSLAKLLEKVAQVEGLSRLRLSSLEPADVTEKLLDTFCSNLNVMPHLHLPLQSGSERILKKMCRQYSIDEFLEVVEKIKLRLDRPAITTDIIVGFPGENDDDFEKTCEIAKTCEFSKIHVFSFSPRQGTAAARMQHQVEPEVIKARSKQLRALDTEAQKSFRRQFTGEKMEIIVEDTNPVRGRCERYFMVEIGENGVLEGTGKITKGNILRVKLTD